MEILETISIKGDRRVELCQGDLTDLERNEWFDAIVVSAFDGDYTPTERSLVGALDRKGISVADLATRKALDYVADYGTWLSEPVRSSDPAIGFSRVLCFEPARVGRPPEVVGHLFRALVPIVAERPQLRTVAMPVLSTGDAGHTIEEMLPPLLDAAVNNLAHGLPVDRIGIFVRSDEDAAVAREHFAAAMARAGQYDVFVSYSQKDSAARDDFVKALKERRRGTEVFIDKVEIDHGAAWQRQIFQNLERCQRIVCLLTPNYLASDICLEEFNIAWMRSRDAGDVILKPLFVADAELPAWIRSRQYIDCREFDAGKLADAASSVADSLG